MTPRVFRAPGKVVLVGEYAVVDGAPAVVAAVDRGVACVVTPSDGPSDGRLIETPEDDRFVRAALDAAGAGPGRYVFTDWNPVGTAEKVGLGGSAAATVVAVLAADPGRPVDERHALADRVHRAVQGSGSGIDVAASTFGGVIRFEAGRARPLAAVSPVVVYTGIAARTGPRVERYARWSGRDAFVAASREIVDAFPADPVAALRENGRLLRAMAEAAGIAYWTGEIDAVVRAAEAFGGAAKPSGAGGGDVVVALFADPAASAAFAAATPGRVVPVSLAGPASETSG